MCIVLSLQLPDMNGLPRREVDVQKGLKHKNIVQFLGFILREGKPEMYFEYGGKHCLSSGKEPCDDIGLYDREM